RNSTRARRNRFPACIRRENGAFGNSELCIGTDVVAPGKITIMAAQELHEITVKGFKSIASIEKLALGPINVVIGPNGSGKSNFIGVFAFLNAIREGRLQDYVTKAGGADKVLHFGAKMTPKMLIAISFQEGVNQ